MESAQQIAVRLPAGNLAEIDAAVEEGRFPSRAAAVRAGVEHLLRNERDRRIAEQYRRAYGQHPQDPAVGDAGLELGAELIRRDDGGAAPNP